MEYQNKKIKKIKQKLKKYHEGDEEPLERIEMLKRRQLMKLSRGGKKERSHKKRVGNIVNKNINKRYNAVQKAIERIENRSKK